MARTNYSGKHTLRQLRQLKKDKRTFRHITPKGRIVYYVKGDKRPISRLTKGQANYLSVPRNKFLASQKRLITILSRTEKISASEKRVFKEVKNEVEEEIYAGKSAYISWFKSKSRKSFEIRIKYWVSGRVGVEQIEKLAERLLIKAVRHFGKTSFNIGNLDLDTVKGWSRAYMVLNASTGETKDFRDTSVFGEVMVNGRVVGSYNFDRD